MSLDKEYMKRYMLNRYYRRQSEAIQKLGGKCVKCESTENLEFDHINPLSKVCKVSDLFASGSKQKLETELAKCQLLCKSCHKDKSIVDNGFSRASHGAITMAITHGCKCEECLSFRSAYNKCRARNRRRANNTKASVEDF